MINMNVIKIWSISQVVSLVVLLYNSNITLVCGVITHAHTLIHEV